MSGIGGDDPVDHSYSTRSQSVHTATRSQSVHEATSVGGEEVSSTGGHSGVSKQNTNKGLLTNCEFVIKCYSKLMTKYQSSTEERKSNFEKYNLQEETYER